MDPNSQKNTTVALFAVTVVSDKHQIVPVGYFSVILDPFTSVLICLMLSYLEMLAGQCF